MRIVHVLAILVLIAGYSSADLVIEITETASAVTLTTDGGSLDLSGSVSLGNGGFSGPQGLVNGSTHGFGDSLAFGIASSDGANSDIYGVTFTPFGSLPAIGASVPFTPDVLGMELGYLPTSGQLIVPDSYVSEAPINYSLTLSGGTTLAAFGFVPGSSWGVTFPTTTGTETLTFRTSAVPEPSSFLFLGLLAIGSVSWSKRKGDRA